MEPGSNRHFDFVADRDVAAEFGIIEMADAHDMASLRDWGILLDTLELLLRRKTKRPGTVGMYSADDSYIWRIVAAYRDLARSGGNVKVNWSFGSQCTLECSFCTEWGSHRGSDLHGRRNRRYLNNTGRSQAQCEYANCEFKRARDFH